MITFQNKAEFIRAYTINPEDAGGERQEQIEMFLEDETGRDDLWIEVTEMGVVITDPQADIKRSVDFPSDEYKVAELMESFA